MSMSAIGNAPVNGALPVNENMMATWTKVWANWFSSATHILNAVSTSGVTADRPTMNVYVGQMYFDTTLGLPIWAKTLGASIAWVKADGTAA